MQKLNLKFEQDNHDEGKMWRYFCFWEVSLSIKFALIQLKIESLIELCMCDPLTQHYYQPKF